RPLGEDGHVDVSDDVASRADAVAGCLDEHAARRVLPARVGVREQLADVPLPDRAEQRVDDRGEHDIAVAVRDGTEGFRDRDPRGHEPGPGLQPVKVVAVADAEWHTRGIGHRSYSLIFRYNVRSPMPRILAACSRLPLTSFSVLRISSRSACSMLM